MLDKFDTIRGTVIGDRIRSTSIVSDDASAYIMKCSVPLPVGATGLFTVTGYKIEENGVTYRVVPDSIEYDVA